MKIIKDSVKLDSYRKKYEIDAHFDTPDLQFVLVSFQKGELITSPHKQLEHILFLVKGSVEIYGLNEDGSSFSVNVEQEGSLLGDIEFSMKNHHRLYTEVLTPCECVALSLRQYQKVLEKDARFLMYLLQRLSMRIQISSLVDLQPHTLKERVLLYLDNIEPNGCIKSVNHVTSILHCERRQLQRVLKQLCEQGLLIKTGKGHYQRVKEAG